MSTAIGVGECFDFSESDVEVEMSSLDVEEAEDCADFGQGKRAIVSSLVPSPSIMQREAAPYRLRVC